MEYTLMEKIDITIQACIKMGYEIVLPVCVGMVLITVVPPFVRGLLNPKPVPARVRKDSKR